MSLKKRFISYCEASLEASNLNAMYSEILDKNTYDPVEIELLLCATIYMIKFARCDGEFRDDVAMLNHNLAMLKDTDNKISQINLLNIVQDIETVNLKLKAHVTNKEKFSNLYM